MQNIQDNDIPGLTPAKNVDSNILIAQFMGAKIWNDGEHVIAMFQHRTPYNPNTGAFEKDMPASCLAYDISYDWLMPVIELIETLTLTGVYNSFSVEIKHLGCNISANTTKPNLYNTKKVIKSIDRNFITHIGDTKLSATYAAVVAFIKWYNEQNNNA